jgi:hypothetical protein
VDAGHFQCGWCAVASPWSLLLALPQSPPGKRQSLCSECAHHTVFLLWTGVLLQGSSKQCVSYDPMYRIDMPRPGGWEKLETLESAFLAFIIVMTSSNGAGSK